MKKSSVLNILLSALVFLLTISYFLYLIDSLNLSTFLISKPADYIIILAGPLVWAMLTWDVRKLDEALWWKGISRSIIYMGSVGTTIGIMKVLIALDRPELITRGFASGFGTMGLAFILSYMVSLYSESLEQKQFDYDETHSLVLPLFTLLTLTSSIFIVLYVLTGKCEAKPETEETPQSQTYMKEDR